MSHAGESRDEPAAERIDKEAEQRELEAAGWIRLEQQGKIVWQNPESGHLYPQGAAIDFVRLSMPRTPSEEMKCKGPEDD